MKIFGKIVEDISLQFLLNYFENGPHNILCASQTRAINWKDHSSNMSYADLIVSLYGGYAYLCQNLPYHPTIDINERDNMHASILMLEGFRHVYSKGYFCLYWMSGVLCHFYTHTG